MICERKYVKEVYEEIAEHYNVRRMSVWNWVEDFINNQRIDSYILDVYN